MGNLLPNVASVDTFGGPKENLHPVVDPRTDNDADDWTRLITQAAMASYTQPRGWVRCTVSGGVITLADHSAVWGDTVAVAPLPVRSGAGAYTVTWAASYNDLQEDPESNAVNIRACTVSGYESSPAARIIQAEKTAANVVTVKAFDAAGSAADVTSFTVFIY